MGDRSCPHGMPSPASCLTCMEDDGLGAAPTPPLAVVKVITARFPGRCAGCDGPIHPGEPLALMSDQRHRHAYHDCLP